MDPKDAPPEVPLALLSCPIMPLELSDLTGKRIPRAQLVLSPEQWVQSGVTFDMSTKYLHYLPYALNHFHSMKQFNNRLDQFQQSIDITGLNRILLKEV